MPKKRLVNKDVCPIKTYADLLEEYINYSRHTKNRKARISPICKSLKKLLIKWLDMRKYESKEDGFFVINMMSLEYKKH